LKPKIENPTIKTGLFVFFVCHVEISSPMRPPIACLVPLEKSWQRGVHGLCLVTFELTVGKLLNFKVFL